MKALVLVIIAEIWTTLGQVCLKKSANRLQIPSHPEAENPTIRGRLRSFSAVFSYPVLWLGAAGMILGMLFWFGALSSGDLSFVYLLGSIQYIFALFAAHLFLGEKINTPKLIGTVLIILGIILTAVS